MEGHLATILENGKFNYVKFWLQIYFPQWNPWSTCSLYLDILSLHCLNWTGTYIHVEHIWWCVCLSMHLAHACANLGKTEWSVLQWINIVHVRGKVYVIAHCWWWPVVHLHIHEDIKHGCVIHLTTSEKIELTANESRSWWKFVG